MGPGRGRSRGQGACVCGIQVGWGLAQGETWGGGEAGQGQWWERMAVGPQDE